MLSALEDGPGGVTWLRNARPVDLRLVFRLVPCWGSRTASLQNMGAHTLRFIRLDRAGVGLLFRYADFDQSIENGFALDLQFTR